MLKILFQSKKAMLLAFSLIAVTMHAQERNYIDMNSISLPKNFLMGAIDMHHLGPDHVAKKLKTAQDDLNLIKPLGFNGHCFAIAWDLAEPTQHTFDASVLKHYAQKCKELKESGIEPFIVLHFYKTPQWFMDLGGFEKEENIDKFVWFCKKTIEAIGAENIGHVITMYQPAGYVLERYFRGIFPPHKKNMQLALNVLKNMLTAHVQIYEMIKALAGGHKIKVGLVHQIFPLEPYHAFNPLDQLGAMLGNRLNNELVLEFFSSGELSFTVPSGAYPYVAHIDHENVAAPRSLDFIGIAYLSHNYMKNFQNVPYKNEIKTDNDIFTIYPEGLYHSIEKVSSLNRPIYVIGNGIADTYDKNREFFISWHLYMVSQAIAQGFNVQGYFYRSLVDADEKLRFGLYELDFNTLQETMRPSATYFNKLMVQHKKRHKIVKQ
jgi:beta-glucosidase/6-phospho-beta-glucosidase/beta-galactosidase